MGVAVSRLSGVARLHAREGALRAAVRAGDLGTVQQVRHGLDMAVFLSYSWLLTC
jgi:hypothetical protein